MEIYHVSEQKWIWWLEKISVEKYNKDIQFEIFY